MAARVTMSMKITNPPHPHVDDTEVQRWIEERLNDARNHFIRSVSRGGGGGIKYGKHRASAPGEYPATDSGRLVNSVDYQMDNPRQGRLHSDVKYAAYLTDGTRYMAPRKMLIEAVTEVLDARPKEDQL